MILLPHRTIHNSFGGTDNRVNFSNGSALTGALKVVDRPRFGNQQGCAIIEGASFPADNRVYCWGQNRYGWMGNGVWENTTVEWPRPVKKDASTELTGVIDIAWDGDRIWAVDVQGALWTWGYETNAWRYNSVNALAYATQVNTASPWNLPTNVRKVFVTQNGNSRATCVINSTGALWCNGVSYRGGLNAGARGYLFGPSCTSCSEGYYWQEVETNGVTDVAMSSYGFMFYIRNGRLYGLGTNQAGFLGLGHTNDTGVTFTTRTPQTNAAGTFNSTTKREPIGPGGVGLLADAEPGATVVGIQISPGWVAELGSRVCAEFSNGAVYCWGSNNAFALTNPNPGLGVTGSTFFTAPIQVYGP
jgi:hypothetical protein